ncbi:MAG: hypothetical protein D6798_14760 [Deltaproteobacteria bacterium]|nr:MAG: hypothetical protein D6798_14760 [Deltaproteobacteria bacterium]
MTTPSASEVEAQRRQHLQAVLAGLSPSDRRRLAPVLRQVVHDLNGYLSTLSMEGFTIGYHASRMTSASKTGAEGSVEALTAALDNLRQATEDAVAYVAHLRDLAEGDDGG